MSSSPSTIINNHRRDKLQNQQSFYNKYSEINIYIQNEIYLQTEPKKRQLYPLQKYTDQDSQNFHHLQLHNFIRDNLTKKEQYTIEHMIQDGIKQSQFRHAFHSPPEPPYSPDTSTIHTDSDS